VACHWEYNLSVSRTPTGI